MKLNEFNITRNDSAMLNGAQASRSCCITKGLNGVMALRLTVKILPANPFFFFLQSIKLFC